MGGKITLNVKELHKNRKKEETQAHRKRARSALNRVGTLELRQWCTKFGSVRFDSTRVVKVNRRKTNRRKTKPYCI